MPESRSTWGPLVSGYQVEVAVLETLRTWFSEALAQLELQHGLRHKTLPRPPAPESYHGGVDFDTWRQDITPEVIVVVKPSSPPELSASAGYTQGYAVAVGCLWVGAGSELAENPEDEARAVAFYLGAASMVLVQKPELGGLAERLIMTSSPEVTLPDPDTRRIAQVVTTFEVWVTSIIEENAGPVQPLPSESPEFNEPEGPYDELPEAEKVEVKITATKEVP